MDSQPSAEATPVQVRFMRNSERAVFRRCRLKWHWSYELLLNAPRTKGALSFGTLVHEALAERYPPGRKRGPHPARTFERLYQQQQRQFDQWDEEGNRIDALELGIAMLENYVREYGNDDHIEIIAPEIPLSVNIYDRRGKYLTTWVGRGDAAYKDLLRSTRQRAVIGLMEHKTAKSVPRSLSIISGYGDQGHAYWWGSSHVFTHEGLLPPGTKINHVMFNWLKKAIPTTKVTNAQGYVLNKPKKEVLVAKAESLGMDGKGTVEVLMARLKAAGVDATKLGEVAKVQPTPLLMRDEVDYGSTDHAVMDRRMRMEAREMKMVREGKLGILKNPTKDCDWDCQFKEACELHEMGQDYMSILELEFAKWNPYEDHELLEERQ